MNFINEFFNELLFKDKQVEGFMFDVADGLDVVSEHIVSVKSAMHDEMDFRSIFTLAFKLVLKLLIIVLSVIFTKYMFENCVIVTLLPQYDNLILPNFLDKVLMTTSLSIAIKGIFKDDYLDNLKLPFFVAGLCILL